jgi:hypothetical protein
MEVKVFSSGNGRSSLGNQRKNRLGSPLKLLNLRARMSYLMPTRLQQHGRVFLALVIRGSGQTFPLRKLMPSTRKFATLPLQGTLFAAAAASVNEN